MVLKDLLLVLLPSGLVLFGMYSLVQSFLQKQYEQKLLDLKQKNTDIILPVRLQAYERITLLLERISPDNLLLRVNGAGMTCAEFQQILTGEIRSEFNHNLAQQIYLSEPAWEKVVVAVNDTIATINMAASELDQGVPAIELSKKILGQNLGQDSLRIREAIHQLKDEIQQTFL